VPAWGRLGHPLEREGRGHAHVRADL
jgi:hypothetical protein